MPLGPDTDEEILARVRLHDENALKRLLRRYENPLSDFSYSMLRSRDLANEVVSNVFLNIWRRRDKLVIKTTVRSYLFAAAGNQSINLWKQRKKHPTVWLNEVHARQLIEPRRTDSDLLFRELHDEVDALLSLLPPQRQLVFRLNRIEGLSYIEIAKALTLSEHTVQNHMTQATRQLEKEWPKFRRTLGKKEPSALEERSRRKSVRG